MQKLFKYDSFCIYKKKTQQILRPAIFVNTGRSAVDTIQVLLPTMTDTHPVEVFSVKMKSATSSDTFSNTLSHRYPSRTRIC